MGEKPHNLPFPLGHVGLGPPTHYLKRQLDRSWFTHFRTTTSHSPHWLQLDAHTDPQNSPFPLTDLHSSNTPIRRLTQLTIPNGIQIGRFSTIHLPDTPTD